VTSVPRPPDGGDDGDNTGDNGDNQSIDAAFDAIVANINHPDTAASTAPWPDAENDVSPAQPEPPLGVHPRTPSTDWTGWDDLRPAAEESESLEASEASEAVDGSASYDDEDEGHYVPPPPPPVPKGDNLARWAWAGAVGAPILAILLPLIGWNIDGVTGLLLVTAFLAGFVTLLSRLRSGPRVDDGPDDGAVV
jgi:hypothetical protein